MDTLFRKCRYPVAPLGLASIAALTPSDWEVTIVDEAVEALDLNFAADVVGVGGMALQYSRQRELLLHFRSRGCHVVAGGNHASLAPEHYEEVAHTVIAGEAESIWPEFCADFLAGRARPLYRETGSIELDLCPVPRFDLLKLDRYSTAALQFSRGCPFRCEFCDIIVIFGRKPRTKSLSQIGTELDALRRLNVRNVFFVDDNLIGHKPRCKELLRFLADYQRRHDYRFFFGSEASLDLSQDEELLALFRAANFGWLFIGIESPNEDSLRETLKFQNTREDPLKSVRKIYDYGIHVQAGFIVGFDSDDETIFEKQFRFIQAAGITVPMVGMLVAIYRTPLWERLEKAGRIRDIALSPTAMLEGTSTDNTGLSTNFIPSKMTYRELVSGYASLLNRIYEEDAIYQRICNKMQAMGEPAPTTYLSFPDQIYLAFNFLRHGIWPGGPRRWWNFFKTLLLIRGSRARLDAVIDGWVTSITFREFVLKRFSPSQVEAELAEEPDGARQDSSRD